ncbi:MAG: flavodoxin family protein [Desulfovibrionaceae bacterium]
MNVVAFNGSARLNGNTALLLNAVLDPIRAAGMDARLIQLGPKPLAGCIACYQCFENKDRRCAMGGDAMNDYIQAMFEADAVLIGSPSYFADVTSNVKSLMDRAGMVAGANGNPLRRKVGAAVAVARRAGTMHVLDTINHLFASRGMVVPGSSYWNLGYGREPGKAAEDAEALNTMRELGENIAWLLEKLHN